MMHPSLHRRFSGHKLTHRQVRMAYSFLGWRT